MWKPGALLQVEIVIGEIPSWRLSEGDVLTVKPQLHSALCCSYEGKASAVTQMEPVLPSVIPGSPGTFFCSFKISSTYLFILEFTSKDAQLFIPTVGNEID